MRCEFESRYKRIAAIIAGANSNQYASNRGVFGEQCKGGIGNRFASALHQGSRR
jgi:hypothetical protein